MKPPDMRYARAREEARRELARTPVAVIREGAGTEAGGDVLGLRLLGSEVTVSYPEGRVRVAEGSSWRDATLAEELLVLHYLTRAAGPLSPDDLVRYPGLPGSAGYTEAFVARAEAPLAAAFAQNPAALLRALEGVPAKGQAPGQEEGLWLVEFFPYLPLGLRLDPAVEGLPASCVILFPRRAGFLHHVEDLAVMGELLAARLLDLAGAPRDDILYTERPGTAPSG